MLVQKEPIEKVLERWVEPESPGLILQLEVRMIYAEPALLPGHSSIRTTSTISARTGDCCGRERQLGI
jgi:hypothetical protein